MFFSKLLFFFNKHSIAYLFDFKSVYSYPFKMNVKKLKNYFKP